MKEDKLIPGSLIGAMLLVAGSCVGAGMLALPVLTGLCGFTLAVILLFLAWGFMTYTALLLLEINGWFYKQVNIISMAAKGFGTFGKVLSWSLYLFLFYSLLVAYIAGGSSVVSMYLGFLSTKTLMLLFTGILAIVVFFGTKSVDFVNRILMVGLIVTYFAMILLGFFKIEPNLLKGIRFEYVLLPLPVLITSFGFHNMIPSLTAYLKGDLRRMRLAIIGGSAIALFIYLIWQFFVIGVVPFEGKQGLLMNFQRGKEVGSILQVHLKNSAIVYFSQGFALFAIITSFIAQALSLMHFIGDGLKIEKVNRNILLLLLTFIPPLLFAMIYPSVFYQALGFAGGICATILFGVMPALLAWIGRYNKKFTSQYHVFGSKIGLIIILAFSLIIILNELFKLLGFALF